MLLNEREKNLETKFQTYLYGSIFFHYFDQIQLYCCLKGYLCHKTIFCHKVVLDV